LPNLSASAGKSGAQQMSQLLARRERRLRGSFGRYSQGALMTVFEVESSRSNKVTCFVVGRR